MIARPDWDTPIVCAPANPDVDEAAEKELTPLEREAIEASRKQW